MGGVERHYLCGFEIHPTSELGYIRHCIAVNEDQNIRFIIDV